MSETTALKTGGTSNATAAAFEQSMACVERIQPSLYIASAPGKLKSETGPHAEKVTDMLYGTWNENILNGEVSQASGDLVTCRYDPIYHGLGKSAISRLPYGHGWLDQVTPRIRQAVGQSIERTSMLGEELMAELCAAALGWGILDPANARHNLGSSRHAWRGWIRTTWKPGQQNVLIGNKTIVNGEPVTFSRGGSDTSEGFGAFAISAGMCFNMTDGGASSADPEIVGPDRVQPLAHLLYDEGRELGRNGTGLFHPAAMVPLMLGDIPTRICSTFDPDAPFTTLDNDKSRAEYRAGRIIALSLMKDVVVYTVHEPGMAEASGRLKAFDAALAKRHITIIDSEGDGVDRQRFYVGANSADMAAEALLRSTRRKGGELSRTSPLSFITLVGYDLWRRYIDNTFNLALGNGALGKQWQSQNYPISHGSHSIRIGVPSNEALTTLSALHGKFVESSYASAHLYDKS